MKVIIALDGIDLNGALRAADAVHPFCDAFCLGPALLYCYGMRAAAPFKSHFEQKELMADAKIIIDGPDVVRQAAQFGVSWVTMLAGAQPVHLHATATVAVHEKIKLIMDLSDALCVGQSAMEAPGFDATALLWHLPTQGDDSDGPESQWEFVRENSQIPVFIHVPADHVCSKRILGMHPDGIMIHSKSMCVQNMHEIEGVYQACKSFINPRMRA